MGTRVRIDVAGPITLVRWEPGLHRKVDRRVLAVLALAGGPVSAARLGDAVWDGRPPPTWETALRGAVSRLRRALDAVGATDGIQNGPGGRRLSAAIEVDVVEAAAAVERAEAAWRRGDVSGCLASLDGTEPVLERDLASGEDGTWFDDERRRYGEVHLRSLVLAADASAALGRWQAVIDACDAIIRVDALDEPAYRRAIAAHASLGDRAGALRT